MTDRDTHFLGFAKLLFQELYGVDNYFEYPVPLRIIAQRAYDLMQSGCIDINNAQMQQGGRLHPNAMLRVVQDLTQWAD